MSTYLIYFTVTVGIGLLGFLVIIKRNKRSFLSKAGILLVTEAMIIEQIIYFVITHGIVHLSWGITLITLLVFYIIIVFKRDIVILRESSNNLKKLSKYDLNIKIDEKGLQKKDEFGLLSVSMKTMVKNLNELIIDIKENSNNLSTVGKKLSETSEELLSNSNNQNQTIEEISVSVEEMTTTIETNTEKSQITEEYAKKAETEILKTQQASEETSSNMNTIAEKVQVIQDISQKTNLLAINAAIEAAIAGEQGKGFAVVATEIRKLSDHIKVRADEIISLVNSNAQKAEHSNKILNEVIPNIKDTANLVKTISDASSSQNENAKYINQSVQNFNSAITNNTFTAEELSKQAVELSRQSDYLKNMVGKFNLSNS